MLGLLGCTPEQPEFVYVPAETYTISVEISVPGEARVGEWIPLSAQRRAGPWKRVRRNEVPPGVIPFGKPPAQYEPHAAPGLDWMTEPGGARFDVPLTPVKERKVKFEKPGTYQIWAREAYPTDAKSNVVTVTVK